MNDAICRTCLRFGWIAIAVFLLLGLALESLHLIKAPFYLEMGIRRELWTLAHAHGALLGVICVVFGLCAHKLISSGQSRRRASVALRTGSILVPGGFFLGGIANSETDPSLAIILVPIGAVLVLAAVIIVAVACFRSDD